MRAIARFRDESGSPKAGVIKEVRVPGDFQDYNLALEEARRLQEDLILFEVEVGEDEFKRILKPI